VGGRGLVPGPTDAVGEAGSRLRTWSLSQLQFRELARGEHPPSPHGPSKNKTAVLRTTNTGPRPHSPTHTSTGGGTAVIMQCIYKL
jgi:hypothetical protein